jgi:tetratricopeptide (TPR) repeat protein
MNRISVLLELLKESPDDAFILYAIGLEFEKSGDHHKAMEFYSKLIKNHPDYLPTYYMFAHFLYQRAEYQNAYKIAQEGIHLSDKLKDPKTKLELESLMDEIEDRLN